MNVIDKAKQLADCSHSYTCASQDEDDPWQPCDCQPLGNGEDIAKALIDAAKALRKIASSPTVAEAKRRAYAALEKLDARAVRD